jgi:SLOG in TRPM, prokaryote
MAVELVDVVGAAGRAVAVRVDGREDLGTAVERLGLARAPVLVLVGGAAHMSGADTARVRDALAHAIVPVVERAGATVVDGATKVGVMELAGDVRAELGARFPLVGVIVAALVGDAELDDRHTHFVLVPGEEWGDESELLAAFAAAVADGSPSVTVLANGGDIAWDDVAVSIAEERRVVVLADSGRTADELAAAATTRARSLHESGFVAVVPVTDSDAIGAALARALGTSAP